MVPCWKAVLGAWVSSAEICVVIVQVYQNFVRQWQRHVVMLVNERRGGTKPGTTTTSRKMWDGLVACHGIHWWVVLRVRRQGVNADTGLRVACLGDLTVANVYGYVVNTGF